VSVYTKISVGKLKGDGSNAWDLLPGEYNSTLLYTTS